MRVLLTTSDRTTIRYNALLDSGADVCAFPIHTALMLGINLDTLEKRFLIGLGGSRTPGYVDLVTIDLGNDLLFQTEVQFTAGLLTAGFGLLGQKGLFENFDVSFSLRRGVFTVG